MNIRLPVTFCAICTFLIILACEIRFWRCTDPLSGAPFFEPSADVGTVMAKHSMLAEAGGKVLLVGDSSCMMGLIPETVAGGSDDCLNLGTLSSFTLAGVESIVAEAVQSETPPRAIVVAVLPQTLEVSEEQAEEFGLVGPYLLAYRQSSVSYSPTLNDWHKWVFRKHQFGKFPEQFGGKYADFRDLLEQSRGYFEEPGHYEGTETPRKSVKLSDFSRRSVASIADMCREHKIPFVVWLSPVPRDSVTDAYLNDSQQIAKDLSTAGLLDLGRAGSPAWDPTLFGSVTHLTREGAERNSAELSEFLKSRHVADPRGRDQLAELQQK